MSATAVPLSAVRWKPAYRVVSSRFPTVGPWDRITDPADFEALFELESMTNPRLREEIGVLALVPADRRIAGPGTTPIMAAFTHVNPEGSRFSDGSYGVLYAANTLQCAIEETKHHRARFLAATREPPLEIEMRCYHFGIDGVLSDLRTNFDACHEPDSYAAARILAAELRRNGSNGIVYRSVRQAGTECVALFYPNLAEPCTQTKHFTYRWDGQRISHVFEKRLVS